MKQENKLILGFITFGIVLFAVSMNFQIVFKFLGKFLDLFFPIIVGLVIAFILNVPMVGIETRLIKLCRRFGWKPKRIFIQGLSLFLTLAGIVFVITLACTWVIPAVAQSIQSIQPIIQQKIPDLSAWLETYQIDLSMLSTWAEGIDFNKVSLEVGTILGSFLKVANTTVSGITSFGFGFVIAIYILISKNTLSRQIKKFISANFREPVSKRIYDIAIFIKDTYSKFFTGQCMEAIILGILIFIAYSLFGLPYASLIGFLTSLFAFIPYIGAFASCGIGAFLIALVDPSKLLMGIGVYLIIQFIENQFIYPNVVGTSVGLSPLWTLIAAMVGGKVFGLLGIIFFIPLAAVLFSLIREDTNRKLKKNGVEIDYHETKSNEAL